MQLVKTKIVKYSSADIPTCCLDVLALLCNSGNRRAALTSLEGWIVPRLHRNSEVQRSRESGDYANMEGGGQRK